MFPALDHFHKEEREFHAVVGQPAQAETRSAFNEAGSVLTRQKIGFSCLGRGRGKDSRLVQEGTALRVHR